MTGQDLCAPSSQSKQTSSLVFCSSELHPKWLQKWPSFLMRLIGSVVLMRLRRYRRSAVLGAPLNCRWLAILPMFAAHHALVRRFLSLSKVEKADPLRRSPQKLFPYCCSRKCHPIRSRFNVLRLTSSRHGWSGSPQLFLSPILVVLVCGEAPRTRLRSLIIEQALDYQLHGRRESQARHLQARIRGLSIEAE